MPKTKSQKAALISKYQDLLASAKMVVLVNYQGLSMPQAEVMRQWFFERGERFMIVKNNLLRLALNRRQRELDPDWYGQPLAVAVNSDDEVAVCQDVAVLAKELGVLRVVGGLLDGQPVATDYVNRLAALPSREELLAKLVGTVAAPLTGLVRVVRGPIGGLLNVINQASHK